MRNWTKAAAVAATIAALLVMGSAPAVQAQDTEKNQMGKMHMKHMKKDKKHMGGCMSMATYEPTDEVIVQGTVKMKHMKCKMHGMMMVHLELTEAGSTFDVYVAPESFLEENLFEIVDGDFVTIVGAPGTAMGMSDDGNEALIAREISTGSQILAVRDPAGTPLWPQDDMAPGAP